MKSDKKSQNKTSQEPKGKEVFTKENFLYALKKATRPLPKVSRVKGKTKNRDKA